MLNVSMKRPSLLVTDWNEFSTSLHLKAPAKEESSELRVSAEETRSPPTAFLIPLGRSFLLVVLSSLRSLFRLLSCTLFLSGITTIPTFPRATRLGVDTRAEHLFCQPNVSVWSIYQSFGDEIVQDSKLYGTNCLRSFRTRLFLDAVRVSSLERPSHFRGRRC